MKISRLILGFVAISVLLATSVVVLTNRLGDALRSVERAQERRHASYQLADELRRSSDDLTRFARTFVVTGDERYERYFRQVLSIRNGVMPRPMGYGGVYWDAVAAGEIPEPVRGPGENSSLEQRMSAVGFTEAEFDLLTEAQSRSDALVGFENEAMNAVKGLFDGGTGNFTIQGEPDRDRAVALEMSGEPVLRVLAPPVAGDPDVLDSARPVQRWFRDVAESGSPVEAVGRALTGEEFPVEVVVSEAQIADSPVFICTTRDISGVTEMDAQVASYLAKVAKASQLMGCECIISGVLPMVAHNLVDLGVNLGEVRTTATMKDALARAFRLLGIRFS